MADTCRRRGDSRRPHAGNARVAAAGDGVVFELASHGLGAARCGGPPPPGPRGRGDIAAEDPVNQRGEGDCRPASSWRPARAPADPGRSGSTITVSLAASGKQSVEYGNNQNPSLNGRVISPSTNGAFAGGSPSKTTRGSTWDRVLNIHHTLTFSGAGGLNVAGPQT
ncbi:hypothetical protein X949_2901 [Burkholderia pseudomallei MSHR5609]|nr:hypothetical protein X949_2901 [Burkholderia pseudomallei MSHR5609]CAJ3295609.1 Uncharacterised protein [Burkholderia pseudomallei]CAJ4705656.1 Uncharacterised protein [Burkholderia pseudomallei]